MISKRMNNESYIRITLPNLAALLARANVLVYSTLMKRKFTGSKNKTK
jgi:hypothetical protein